MDTRRLGGKSRAKLRGMPPGTLVHVGDKKTEEVRVTVMDFDEAAFSERQVADVAECFALKDTPSVTWINVDGLHDVELIEKLGAHFGLHPLVMGDIATTDLRPKLEDMETYLFVSLKMLRWDDDDGRIDIEHVTLILTDHCLLSFQERPGDVFEAVRDRIRTAKGRIRKMGADYLAYSLVDAIVDGYFTALEKLGDKIEAFEDRLVSDPTPKMLQAIHRLKGESLYVRKSIWPLREVLSALQRAESPLISEAINIYLRDVYDHTIQVIDTVETFRDMLAGMAVQDSFCKYSGLS